MERKLTKVVDGNGITVTGIPENKFSGSSDKNADKSHSLSSGKMCSCGTDVANDLCSWECPDTYRDCGVDTKNRYVEILEFTQFVEFFTFNKIADNHKEKELVKKITVVVALDLGSGNTKNSEYESE